MNTNFLLYGTDGCHLCELADALCAEKMSITDYTVVDIVDDAELVAKFAVKIPVLQHRASQACLYWPFNKQDLTEFLGQWN